MPDENKSYAFITDTEGYIYCYDSENEEIIYYTSPSDGSYPIQTVNCWEKKAVYWYIISIQLLIKGLWNTSLKRFSKKIKRMNSS